MHGNKELIAYYDKKLIQSGYILIPIAALFYMYHYGIYVLWSFIANVLFCFFKTNPWFISDIGYYVIFSLKALIIFFIVSLAFAFVYNFFLSKSTIPVIIVNSRGMFIKHFGFIPWSNISEVDYYLGIPYKSGDAVGIRVKDTSLLNKQTTFSGKLTIFYSKKFGYPTIIVSNITIESHEIISFVRQFISK